MMHERLLCSNNHVELPSGLHACYLLLLIGLLQGWEYTVLERELGAHRDPLRKMLVTVRFPQLSCLGFRV